TLGTDLEQQKLTLPLIHMLQRSPADQASRFRQILSAPGNHKLDVLFPALESTGALASAKRAAEDFARRAARELDGLPTSPALDLMHSLTHWAVAREF